MEILRALPDTFIPIFVAVDIFAILPVFLSMTVEMPARKKKAIIRDSVITAFVVALGFLALGEAIFRVLGITVEDFKVAGGLVLLVFAVREIVRQDKARRPVGATGAVPLGVPLIVGPAVLTTILVLVDHYGAAPTVVSLVLNMLIVWLSLNCAEKVTKFLGKNGIIAVSKVMALLLAAIAVMMIRLGMEGILKGA